MTGAILPRFGSACSLLLEERLELGLEARQHALRRGSVEDAADRLVDVLRALVVLAPEGVRRARDARDTVAVAGLRYGAAFLTCGSLASDGIVGTFELVIVSNFSTALLVM